MSQEIMKQETQVTQLSGNVMSIAEVKKQLATIQSLMQEIMIEGEHYGIIPGCKKKSIYKSGAELIGFTFRLRPEYEIDMTELSEGHREYRVICRLYNINTGISWGEGVGSCSTMEPKYRYRGGQVESTGNPVPREYWKLKEKNPDEAQKLIGGKGFSTKKIEGRWEIVEKVAGEKIENPDIADQYNTVLKMAKKRAYNDSILTTTAASNFYMQLADITGDDDDDITDDGKNGKNQNGKKEKMEVQQNEVEQAKKEADRKLTPEEKEHLSAFSIATLGSLASLNAFIHQQSKGKSVSIDGITSKNQADWLYGAIERFAKQNPQPEQEPENKKMFDDRFEFEK